MYSFKMLDGDTATPACEIRWRPENLFTHTGFRCQVRTNFARHEHKIIRVCDISTNVQISSLFESLATRKIAGNARRVSSKLSVSIETLLSPPCHLSTPGERPFSRGRYMK